MVYLGLDVSKLTVDCVFMIDSQFTHVQISNNDDGFRQLLDYISNHKIKQLHACCESTGNYYLKLASYLHNNGISISVINPLAIKNYARLKLSRIKTDKQDAKLIAQFCANQQPKLWQPDSPLEAQIRSLNKRYDQLNHMLVAEKNRQQVADDHAIGSIENMLAYIQSEISSNRQQLQALIEENDELSNKQKLLQTIPGIGQTTAAWLLSVMINTDKYPSSKHMVSYLGLTPVIKNSGTSVRGKQAISKMGDRAIRKALYMPARAACTRSKLWRPWYDAKLKAGKHPKQIYVSMMRKMCIYAYTILKTGQPFNENLHKSVDS